MSNYQEISKKRLMTNIKKKFDTTIIGSLDAFEKTFGELWGHGLPEDQLTEDQLELRDCWQEVRTHILDAGHSNSRAAQSEIAQYTLSWNRYVMHLKPVGEIEQGN